jgi:hypothetical protein
MSKEASSRVCSSAKSFSAEALYNDFQVESSFCCCAKAKEAVIKKRKKRDAFDLIINLSVFPAKVLPTMILLIFFDRWQKRRIKKLALFVGK